MKKKKPKTGFGLFTFIWVLTAAQHRRKGNGKDTVKLSWSNKYIFVEYKL